MESCFGATWRRLLSCSHSSNFRKELTHPGPSLKGGECESRQPAAFSPQRHNDHNGSQRRIWAIWVCLTSAACECGQNRGGRLGGMPLRIRGQNLASIACRMWGWPFSELE